MVTACLCLAPYEVTSVACPGHGRAACVRRRRRTADFRRRWREQRDLALHPEATCRADQVATLWAITSALWPVSPPRRLGPMTWAVWDRERKRPLSFHRDRQVAVIQMGVDRAGAACGKVDASTDLDVVLWGYGTRGPAARKGL